MDKKNTHSVWIKKRVGRDGKRYKRKAATPSVLDLLKTWEAQLNAQIEKAVTATDVVIVDGGGTGEDTEDEAKDAPSGSSSSSSSTTSVAVSAAALPRVQNSSSRASSSVAVSAAAVPLSPMVLGEGIGKPVNEKEGRL